MTINGVHRGVHKPRGDLKICPRGWWYKCLSGGLQVKHTLVQGRCNQIDTCPGCTLKPVPGGVDKTNACPGDFTYCLGGGGGGGGGGGRGGYVCNYCHL